MKQVMDERSVKAATLGRVRALHRHRARPIVTAEFSLGSSGVRADLACFQVGENTGFEIKTARDNLKRLPAQLSAYACYFDRVVIVAAPCHVPNVLEADLYGAEVWTYDERGIVALVREGVRNVVERDFLDDAMTKAERRKGCFDRAVAARYSATSGQFWHAVARRPVRPNDVRLLSRFADLREQARRVAAERQAWWTTWSAAQPSQSSSVSSAASGSA